MKKSKIILLIVLTLISSLFLNNFAFASETINYQTALSDRVESGFGMFETILNGAYIIVWPLLLVAGQAMDNQLIYGSIIHIDVHLWNIWNMSKNFANFALGFVFLISIFLYILNIKQDKFNPKKIFPKMLVGVVSIQASWFIVSILLDISTIITYSVGAMPLNIISADATLDKKILLQNSNLDLESLGNSFGTGAENQTWFSDGNTNYINCTLENKDGDYYFSGTLFEDSIKDAQNKGIDVNDGKCILQIMGNRLVPADDSIPISETIKKIEEDGTYGQDDGISMSEIINSANGLTGIFYTLIGSFLGTSTISTSGSGITGDTGTASLGAIFVMKMIIALAMIVPIFALVIVLIMRIFIMRVLIAFSPILAFVYSFDLGLSKKLGKYSLGGFLWLIFLPAFVVFALSIGFIFMTILTESIGNVNKDNPLSISASDVGNDKNNCWELGEYFPQICFGSPDENTSGFSTFLDYFSWLIVNIFGIIILWSMVFSAIQSSKITSGIAKSIQNFSKDMLKTAPILPGGNSYGSVKQGMGELSTIPRSITSKQYNEGEVGGFAKSVQGLVDNNNKKTKDGDQDDDQDDDNQDENKNNPNQ
ncbi:hypothetical protein [Candidatus Vampirococcus lugosii]|uniref:Uncharacterized protein n=1 Tax=Candidatus Vampirococcus lugosii TaxID=2789015 RepID=A0ABS5QMR0_9BACT|nr:hypothetical protein [Candidatus Vampirococcus lugosii]MBS8122500.1 hypothetical protein [Candidatus Vampirococcus lugosii]